MGRRRKNQLFHFMVTQGISRKNPMLNYTLPSKKSSAGEVNPAAMPLDFYIRSSENDNWNNLAEVSIISSQLEVT